MIALGIDLQLYKYTYLYIYNFNYNILNLLKIRFSCLIGHYSTVQLPTVIKVQF